MPTEHDKDGVHPIEGPVRDSHRSGAPDAGHAGEAQKQSLKHDKDLSRAMPQDMDADHDGRKNHHSNDTEKGN